MTLLLNPNNYEDQYYGVQGTTWNDPPILSSPAGTRTIDGRQLFLYKDGSKLTQVAWHHARRRLLDLEQPHREHQQREDARDRRVADAVHGLTGIAGRTASSVAGASLGRSK